MSLLKISKLNQKIQTGSNKVKAKSSEPYKIYKKNFPIGKIEISIAKQEVLKKG